MMSKSPMAMRKYWLKALMIFGTKMLISTSILRSCIRCVSGHMELILESLCVIDLQRHSEDCVDDEYRDEDVHDEKYHVFKENKKGNIKAELRR